MRDYKTVKDEIALIRARIAELPRGYISKKIIGGKERLYLQWREGNKIRSRYIKQQEKETILSEIAEKKKLEDRLAELENAGMLVAESETVYGSKAKYYLKWDDDIIGEIDDNFGVRFVSGNVNAAASQYVPDSGKWSREDFVGFLEERIVSSGRRDIEQILYRCGLTAYDPIQIALKTHAISARDLFWITANRNDRFEDAVTEVFDSVFRKGKDLTGDSVDTPEGQNIKRYGVSRGKYGIYKKRLTPVSTDIESEIAAYALGELLKVPCCPCWKVDDNTVFSSFQYNFSKEYIVHFRRLIKKRSYDDELRNLLTVRPEYFDFYVKMIAFDFITRQDDRHLSNIAVKISDRGEAVYPLYDNGRSLFYEDSEETVKRAYDDVDKYSTTFGPVGSYYDYIKEISGMGVSFGKLLNLDVRRNQVDDILRESGFTGYKLDGAADWICSCLDILKSLG